MRQWNTLPHTLTHTRIAASGQTRMYWTDNLRVSLKMVEKPQTAVVLQRKVGVSAVPNPTMTFFTVYLCSHNDHIFLLLMTSTSTTSLYAHQNKMRLLTLPSLMNLSTWPSVINLINVVFVVVSISTQSYLYRRGNSFYNSTLGAT